MTIKLSRSLPLLATAISLGVAGCSDPVDIITVKPVMVLDPASLSFGDVQIGTKVTKTILVQNTGDGNLNIGSVSEGTPYDDAYVYAIDRMTVVPGGVAAITIEFSPTEQREYAAQLVVKPTDATLTDAPIEITGTGVSSALIVNPDALSFGNVVINTTKTLPIMLSNNSDVDADVLYIAGQNVRLCTSGVADPSTFCLLLRDREVRPDNSFTLRAGETATMEVQFTPTIAGTRERGNFTLRGCPGEIAECNINISLDGLGIEQGFRCDPPALDFAQVNPGSCLTRTVSCENIANEQVTVVDWVIGAQSSADYTASAPTVLVLDEGDSVDVEVTYCPDSLGEDLGELQIETDNPDVRLKTLVVELTGTGGGPDIDVLPLTVNFGLVSLIAPSRRTVTIQNVGFQPLEVRQLQINNPTAEMQFSAPNASGDLLEVGEFLDVTIEFQPVMEGPIMGTLQIISNDQDEPDVTVTLVGEGVNLPPCTFEVNPAQLSFGVVERGRTVDRSFEIRNTGSNDCLVTSARMEPGSDQEFSLPSGDVNSVLIAPNAAYTVRAQYAPTMLGSNAAQVEFSISSPTSPFNLVPLSGIGADATLLIVPRDIDFGTIGVGCSARARTVTIYNTGSSTARIDSILVTGNPDAFLLSNLPSPLNASPLNLAAGDSTNFDVGFHAESVSAYAAAVEITGEFGGQPVTYIVSLTGAGAFDATQIDDFEQLGKPKVDILFVVDNSCSMSEEQTSVGSNFGAFIQFAQSQALDYQLGVTTTDVDSGGEVGRLVHASGPNMPFGGPLTDKIVTPQTLPSPEQVFVTNVVRGVSGSASEAGLEAGYLALSNPLIFGHNAGFLRADAVLSVIILSDEPDQSSQPVDFYVNFFLSIKGFRNTNLFTLSSIVGDAGSGCNGPGGNASDGSRYIEAANRTGGVFQSICTGDWSRALEDLSTTAFGFKSRFFLTNQPVINTIEVYIDGVLLPATSPGGTVNWSYDFATNAINFSPFAVPEPGALIRVEYTAECL